MEKISPRQSAFDAAPPDSLEPRHYKGRRQATALAVNLGLSLLFVGAALIATLFLQHLFPYPFLFLFFAAVMASAWFGGTAPDYSRWSLPRWSSITTSCRHFTHSR